VSSYPWSIFISYSSEAALVPDGPVSRLIELLKQEFDQDYRVLVDRDYLGIGDNWDRKIREKLHGANIGIILLDATAAASEWVKRETLIMMETEMAIFTVLIGPTKQKIRKEKEYVSFRSLLEYELIELTTDGKSSVTDSLDHVVAQIRRQLVHFDQTFTEAEVKLIKKLAQHIPDAGPTVTDLIQRLAGPGWTGSDNPYGGREFIAWRMLEARLGQKLVRLFGDMLDCFTRFGQNQRRLTNLIEPSWIPIDDARPIVPSSSERYTVLVGPVGTMGTGEHYVRRATHWDETANNLLRADVMPMAGPDDIVAALTKEKSLLHWQQNSATMRQYVVMRAGDTESATRWAVEAVHEKWPQATVVLEIPSTDDTLRDRLADSIRSARVIDVDTNAETTAELNIHKIREHLRCANRLEDGTRP
jgi:hypothetical protein